MNSAQPSKLAVVVASRGLTAKQEYMKKWRAENQGRIKASRRRWYLEHREEQIKYSLEWTKNNRERDREKSKIYREKPGSKERHREYCRQYYINKEKGNPEWVIKSRLRARLHRAVKTMAKTGSAVDDLGCTIPEFLIYLELKFVDGMTWENWGEWHIDHIKPLVSFDLTDRKQFLQAVNYKNMQPLWAIDNMRKGSR